MRSLFVAVSCLFLACGKEELPESAPDIEDHRTYELVTVAAKADPMGGFVLLGKNSPVDRRTSWLQVLGADGDPGARIDLSTLPRTIENITFPADELLYTDFVALSDGSILITGTGREVAQDDRLHLVVQHVSRTGQPVNAPFRRFLAAEAAVVTNVDGPTTDIDGLPRQRALCDLLSDGSFVVAVRWETATSSRVRLMRFPLGGSGSSSAQTDIALSSPGDRMHALACDPSSGHTVLITDEALAGEHHSIRAYGFNATILGWEQDGASTLPVEDLEPQQLQWDQGRFQLVGNAPVNDGIIKPFVSTFNTAAGAAAGSQVLNGIGAADRPVAAYCSVWWNGGLRVITQEHQASTPPPYFTGDITSDLGATGLDANMNPSTSTTWIPGQGLRAIGAFSSNGHQVIIGSQHPYLNTGYQHTFYLVTD